MHATISMAENPIKVRDLAPTAIRLHPELRHALAREAAINGRTLHAEILHRLKDSLHSLEAGARNVGETRAQPAYELGDLDRKMLTVFRKLSPEKQLALLTLLS
jgi:hypothetical protein